jgi:hypothetical protein
MSANPVDRLEILALQQRNNVHDTLEEVKGKVVEVRAKFDPNANAREHFLAASLIVSSIAFVAGYGFAGIFTRN